MQLYRYQAAKADGAIVRGLLEAPSSGEASGALLDRGLHPLQVIHADPAEGRRRAAGRRELAIVFRSIAALVSAGVPVERAVAASEAVARGALRDVLTESRDQLRAGRSLAQALEGARGVVPPIITGMIRAGERGGRLGAALEQVATQLEHEADLMARVQQALAYPVLLTVAGAASVLMIGTLVVPKFAAVLADLGEELPASTRMLLAGSSFLTSHGLLLCALTVATAWALGSWIQKPEGGLRWDRLLLSTPVVGTVRHTLATARVSRALSGMLHSAMPILPALDAARDAAADRAVAERIGRVRERVAEGQALAPALKRERALSDSALQLFAVGESSGQLATMSARAGDLAAQEAERGLHTLVGLLEPALVVLFGGIVAFVAAALLQAVYSIRPGG
jgi:type II secretory pathway component PulF